MSCSGCQEDAEERACLDRWTDSLTNVLCHEEGRERFYRFLYQRGLEEDLDNLRFWVNADKLLRDVDELNAAVLRDQKESRRRRFDNDSNDLVDFAFEYINMDGKELGQLERIRGDPEEALRVLPLAKRTVAALMDASYKAFRENLIQSRSAIAY